MSGRVGCVPAGQQDRWHDDCVTDQHVGQALTLLLESDWAQALWHQYEQRRRPGGLNRSAIAKVIANAVADITNVRVLEDRLSDALRGRCASVETIRQIGQGFSFPASLVEKLIRLRSLEGVAAQKLLAEITQRGDQPRPYRTVLLRETHYLNRAGLPCWHETMQTIQAVEDRVDTVEYRYKEEPNVVSVEEIAGGEVLGDPIDGGEGIRVTRIRLPQVLAVGQTAALTYKSRLTYSVVPEPAFRRGISPQVERIDIVVHFDPARLPMRVFRCEWPGADAAPTSQQIVTIRADRTVQDFWRDPAAAFVGFNWIW